MRTRIGLIGGALVLLIGAGVAALAYQAGAASTAGGGAAANGVVYGPWFWGFGFFHVIGLLFGLFILFVIARIVIGAVFWGGQGRMGRHGRHWGEGPWGYPDRDAFFADMHRRLHEREQAGGTGTGSSPSGGAPSQPGSGA